MLRAVILAGLLAAGSTVAAVERSSDGYGQVLLFPYFSTNGALSTVATITRTVGPFDSSSRAPLAISVVVKVDTGDAAGTLSTEHFTVLLDDHASWTFTLSQVDGRAALSTDSAACAFRGQTRLPDGPVLFSTAGNEGWVEVHALGNTSIPANLRCSEIEAEFAGLPASEWLTPVGNELRGAAHLVDVPSGTSYSLPTVALKNFVDAPVRGGFDDQPTLADASPPIARVVSGNGERVASTFSEHPIDAVSAVLMDAQWEVDFTSDPGLGARSDLVIVAPTRRWYVDGVSTRAPFASDPEVSPNGAVATVGRLHDRNGSVVTSSAAAKCTPPIPVFRQRGPQIGTSVVVVHFAEQTALDSLRSYEMPHRGPGGAICITDEAPVWQRIRSGKLALNFDVSPTLGVGRLISDEGHVFLGLPVIGVAVTKAVNGDVDGSLANFGLVQWISRTAGYP
jgi:hypothetical protein